MERGICKALGVRHVKSAFPQPRAFRRSDLAIRGPKVFLHKTDGQRVVIASFTGEMYASTDYFRSSKLVCAKGPIVIADAEFYDGKYYIFDILWDGVSMSYMSYHCRLVYAAKLFEPLKDKFVVKEFAFSIDKLAPSPTPTDGYIIVVDGGPNSVLTLKWKPTITVDLLKKGKDLIANDGGPGYKIGEDYDDNPDGVNEYFYTSGYFKFIRARPDKEYGNYLGVVTMSFLAMLDNVTLEDLQNFR